MKQTGNVNDFSHFNRFKFSCFFVKDFSTMEQILASAAQQLEKQLDSEIQRLDNLGSDDLEAIRAKRIKEMKQRQEKIILWKQNVRRKLLR
jgi:hypothetical protein